MSIASDNAALRLMMRALAPTVSDFFENAGRKSGESKYNFYIVMGYDQRGNYEDPKNSRMLMRSAFSDLTARIETHTDRLDKDNKNLLAEIFPIASGYICECAEQWGLEPFGVVMILRLVPGAEGKKDTMEIKIKEKGAKSDPTRREMLVG